MQIRFTLVNIRNKLFTHIKTTNPNTSLKIDGFGFMLYGASNRRFPLQGKCHEVTKGCEPVDICGQKHCRATSRGDSPQCGEMSAKQTEGTAAVSGARIARVSSCSRLAVSATGSASLRTS